ncbi:hypothetical protein SUGI_0175270 [Cryptomeria japonica]|uniref:cytochrome P450 750A1 n=1 Tax=Cryptomeria japonica TaxID=3369 RepID=UPI002408E670|nr:cytochrome P450 750A1 [Cryptomeria japonica]GLJ11716.1 hypothetical protein SUGI_0175270 [Cryptomeria japonica]
MASITPFAILLFFLRLFCIYRRQNCSSRLPPGPFAWPLIGNLHQLGKLPHRSLEELAKKYGPIMSLQLGYFPAIVVSSPEMAKEFLKNYDLAFASRSPSAAGKYLAYNYKSLPLAPYGAYWRLVRRICVTELLGAKRLESFRFVREEEVSAAMSSIWENSRHGAVAVNVSKAVTSLTSAIIWRILAGTKFSDEDLVGREKEFIAMVHEVTGTIAAINIGDFIPYIDWMDLQGIKKRMKNAHAFFDGVMQKIIDEHVNLRQSQTVAVKDILDVLLEMAESGDMTINDIKSIIFVLFIAGIETTATSLEWSMSEMVRNSHIAKKLQQEIESVVGKDRPVRESDLGGMEYLQCVTKESLRLYPPGPLLLPRESTETCIVGAQRFVIPKKTRLVVNVWAIGRDPAIWKDPLTFKPERFIVKDIDIKGRDSEMLPFGSGRRGCPGAAIALGSMELALAQLMHCFDWRSEGDPAKLDMTEAFGTSLNRKESLFAIPSLRMQAGTQLFPTG